MTRPSASSISGNHDDRSPSNLQLAANRQFAREDFEFGSLLGIGALAQVVHVRDTYNGEEYALKILDKKQLRRFGKVAQIINEKDMLSKINHPSIVKLFFTFQDPTWLYLALELCPNGELAELIARKGKLPLNLVMFYAGELVNILRYLRQLGVAHRDIKPENLFISETGHLKLGDFDTAKVVLAGNSSRRDESGQRTERMNTFVGTAQYVSPEMLHDSAVAGFGSDLWALGCVVYQMLTGSPPFKSSSEYVTFQKILATDYSFPIEVPQVGQSFVKALLTLEPQDRLGFFNVDDLHKHPLFAGISVEDLPNQEPPLEGVFRLRKRRVRMTSEDVVDLGDSSDDDNSIFSEGISLEADEDFTVQFDGIAAPQSPSLIRCATTAPVSGNSMEIGEDRSEQINRSPSGELFRVTPSASGSTSQTASGMFKKAESSPALFALSKLRSRSCSNLHIMIEEASSGSGSPKRASSMASGTSAELPPAIGLSPMSSPPRTLPPMIVKSWASHRNLSSKPSVIVESLMARHAMEQSPEDVSVSPHDASMSGVDSFGGMYPEGVASPTATIALNNYLQRICASDERILMSGHVLKRRFFGRNRILVITDLPRLLVLEPKGLRMVCEIPLLSAPVTASIEATSELLARSSTEDAPSSSSFAQGPIHGLVVTYVSPVEFVIETETKTWRGEVRDGSSQAWVSLVQAMKQKAIKAASQRPQRSYHRTVSPQEQNTRNILDRKDFGSMNIMGSVFAQGGVTSDLPSHEELEAQAEARIEAALRLVGSPDKVKAEDIMAALEKQRERSESESDDPYRIEIDDNAVFPNNRPRRRENSTSCSLM
jgi:3-phosphoinositide dependent protein kinase-1